LQEVIAAGTNNPAFLRGSSGSAGSFSSNWRSREWRSSVFGFVGNIRQNNPFARFAPSALLGKFQVFAASRRGFRDFLVLAQIQVTYSISVSELSKSSPRPERSLASRRARSK